MTDRPRFSLAEQHDRDQVIAAVQRYLKTHASVKDARIGCDRLENGFARVSATDGSGKAEPIFGFARRGANGKWDVIAMGTFFDAGFFKQHGIPERLQKA